MSILIRNFKFILNQNIAKSSWNVANYSNKARYTQVFNYDGVRNIVLNDPKTRNSLSLGMMNELLKNITYNQEYVRVILLSAAGPVWSAGHNLKELTSEVGYDQQKEVFSKCTELITAIQEAEIPIIAKVDGICSAAGVQLMASCDMVVCSDKSQFSTPGANVGIFCSTPGIALARVLPRMKTSYMLFTGLPIQADEAHRIGLVSNVVPSEQLDLEVNKICEAIKFKSRAVIALGKKFFYQQIQMDLKTAYAEGAKIMSDNLQMEDGKEGVKSFIEKRKPKWSNSSD